MDLHYEDAIQPAGLWRSVLLFGWPAVLLLLALYGLYPSLVDHGLPRFHAYLLAVSPVFIVLLIAAAFGLWRESCARNKAVRLRLKKWKFSYIAWAVLLVAVGITASSLFAPLTASLIDSGYLPLPQEVPGVIDPRNEQSLESFSQALGGDVSGNYGLLALITLLLMLNVIAEELWWRGYVLPRQELAFGGRAWILHGTGWLAFHAAQYWTMPILLPVCYLLPYVAQKTRSSWPGMIAHLVLNSLGLVPVAILVLS